MLDRIPKPVLFGAVAVLLVLAFLVIFRSAKSAGGAGDYDPAEIKRLAKERESKPDVGRTRPANTNGMGSPNMGSPGSNGSPGSGGR